MARTSNEFILETGKKKKEDEKIYSYAEYKERERKAASTALNMLRESFSSASKTYQDDYASSQKIEWGKSDPEGDQTRATNQNSLLGLRKDLYRYQSAYGSGADDMITNANKMYDSYTDMQNQSNAKSKYKNEGDYKRKQEQERIGWLTEEDYSNNKNTPELASARNDYYENNKKSISEMTSSELDIRNQINEINKKMRTATMYEQAQLLTKRKDLESQLKDIRKQREEIEAENRMYESRQKSNDSYLPMSGNADFAELSQMRDYGNPSKLAIEEADAYGRSISIPDRLGAYLSTSDELKQEAYGSQAGLENEWEKLIKDGDDGNWNELKDDEKQMYYYLLNTSGQEKAEQYLADKKPELNRRAVKKSAQAIKDEDGLLARLALNAASIPASVYGGAVGFAEDAINMATGNPINPYSSAHSLSNFAQNVRSSTAERLDNATGNMKIPGIGFGAGETYQALMSGLDSIMGGVSMGHGYTFVMGLGAASNEASKLYEEGASNTQIALGALTSGVAEAAFEYISLDHFLNEGISKGLVKTILEQGGIEATEEMCTEIANTITNAAIMGSRSEWAKSMDEGGIKQAILDTVSNTISAGLGGFISGAGMAGLGFGGRKLADASDSRAVGRESYDRYSKGYTTELDSIMDQAEGMENLSEYLGTARKALETGDAGEKGSRANNRAIGEVVKGVNRSMYDQAVRTEIKNRLKSEGMDTSDAMVDKVYNEYMNTADLSLAKKDVKNIAKSLKSDTAINTRYGEAYRSMIEKRIGKEVPGIAEKVSENNQTEYTTAAVENTADDSDQKFESDAETKSAAIQKIESIENGVMTFKMSDGTVVDSENVKYSNENQAIVYESMKNLGYTAEEANYLVSMYNSHPTATPIAFVAGTNEAFRYGKMGLELSNASQNGFISSLNELQAQNAWDMGQNSVKQSYLQSRRKMTSKTLPNNLRNEGSIVMDVDYDTLTDRQKVSVDVISAVVSNITHNKVHFYTSIRNKDGVLVYDRTLLNDGNHEAGMKAANGFFDPKTGDIYIDINAGVNGEGVVLYTAAHEFTHFAKEYSPVKYKKLADFLVNTYGRNGVDVNTLVNRKMESAKNNGHPISEEVALEEVVADSMESMFTDGNLYEKLEKLKKHDRSVWQMLKDFIKDFMERIQNFYAGLDPNSYEGKLVKDMKDKIGEISDMFAETLVSAGKTYERIDVKEVLGYDDLLYHERFAEPHMNLISKNFDPSQSLVSKEDLLETYNNVLDIWKSIGIELNSEFLEAWNNQEYKNRVFKVFKAQTGYKYNAELSTMCKKGIPLFEAIDTIVKKEVMSRLDNKTLGKAEKQILYDLLKKRGFEIPCAICYVEQARQREGDIINAFLDGRIDRNSKGKVTKVKLGWNEVLSNVEKEMKANGVDFSFPTVSRDITTDRYTPETIEMDEKTQDAYYNALLKLCNDEITRYNMEEKPKNPKALIKNTDPKSVAAVLKGTLPGNLQIFKNLFFNDDVRFHIDNDMLYSSMTTRNLATCHPSLYTMFNAQGGVNGYKSKQGTVAYLGDVIKSKWNPTTVRKEGGIRNQSNSDFMMYTLLDQAQMYIDLTAKGYYLHAYTKVLPELKLFGKSNAKINASLIPMVHLYFNDDGSVDIEKTRENAGLDADGNPIYDDIEGIPHEEAFMLLSDKEYSKSIGGICIGYSDKHIAKLLDDPRVQLIIGFHDKTDDPSKRYKGARYAHNYNGENEATYTDKDGNIKTEHIGFNQFVLNAEKMFGLKNGEFSNGKSPSKKSVTYQGKTYGYNDIPKLARDMYLYYCANPESRNTKAMRKKPVFTPAYAQFADHENYHKLLADFSLYDSEGNYAPHRRVNFQMPESVPFLAEDGSVQQMESKEFIKKELRKELKVRDDIAQALADTSENGIIEEFVREANNQQKLESSEVKNSLRVGDRDVEYLGDVMTISQHRQFMSEIDTKPKNKFTRSKDGDYIVPIDNMLVYTDFKKSDPGISKIVYIDTDDYTLIDATTYYFLEIEKGKRNYEQARTVIERFVGEGNVRQYTPEMFGVSNRYDRQTKRGKVRSDAYHAERQQRRSGISFETEDDSVKYSDRSQVESDKKMMSPEDVKGEFIRYSERESGSAPVFYSQMESMAESIIREGQPLYSDRDPNSMDARTILSNALLQTAQNDLERKKIEDYQKNIESLNAESDKLAELRKEIRDLSFGKGTRTKESRERLKALKEEATMTANRINTYDKKLMNLESTKILKDVLKREKGKIIEEANIIAKEQIEEYKKKAYDQQERLKQKFNERMVARQDTEIRQKIGKIAENFRQMAMNPTERRFIPKTFFDGIVEICNQIDPTGSDQTTKSAQQFRSGLEALSKLKMVYDSISEMDYEYSSEYEKAYSDAIGRLAQAVGDRPLREMTHDQLKAVHEILWDIQNFVQNATRQIGIDERITNYEAGQEVINEMRNVKELGLTTGKVSTWFREWMDNPMRAVREMTGYKKDSRLVKLFDDINAGRRKADMFSMEMNKKFESLIQTKEDRKNFTDAVEKPIEIGGIKVSKMQAMQAILTYEREQANPNRKHLESKVKFTDVELDRKGKYSDAFDNGEEAYVNQQFIGEALHALNDWDRKYLDVAREFFRKDSSDAINSTSMILKHRPTALEANYVPYYVNQDYIDKEADNVKFDATIEGMGFLKSVVDNASNQLVIRGLNQIIDDHIAKVSKYYGLAVPVRNFNKVFNMRQTKDDGGSALKTEIRKVWGSGGVDLLTYAVADVQSNRRAESVKAFTYVKNIFVQSTLAGNISVWMKQAASYPTAGAVLSGKALTKGLLNYSFKGIKAADVWEEIDAHTSQHYNRRIGLSTQELGDVNLTGGWQNRLNNSMGAKKYLSPMNWIQSMDVGTTAALWYACKAEVEDRGISKSDERYWDEVTKLYDKTIEDTQPMYDALHRAEVTRNPGLKNFITFQTQPIQNSGILREGAMQYKFAKKQYGANSAEAKKAFKQYKMAVGSQLASHFVFTLMTLLSAAMLHKMNAWRDDDKEVTLESVSTTFAKKYGQNIFGAIFPVVGSYAIGIYDAVVNGSEYGVLSDPTVDKVNGSIRLLAKARKKPSIDAFVNIGNEALSYLGIPAQNLYNIVNSARLYMTDFQNGEWFEAGVTRSSQEDYKKVYQAFIEKDQETIDRLKTKYDTNSKWQAEVKKALRDNDERIDEAASAKLNGDLQKYKSIVLQIRGEGNFTQDDIIRSVNFAINDLDTTEKTDSGESKHLGVFANSDMRSALVSGNDSLLSDVRADLVDTKVSNGTEQSKAEKTVTSNLKTAIREALQEGELTEAQAVTAQIRYLGLDEAKAKANARYWKAVKDNPDSTINQSEINKYYEKVEASGISMDQYIKFTERTKDIQGEGKKDRILAVIDSMGITSSQKDALYRAAGYADSTLNKAPWH